MCEWSDAQTKYDVCSKRFCEIKSLSWSFLTVIWGNVVMKESIAKNEIKVNNIKINKQKSSYVFKYDF